MANCSKPACGRRGSCVLAYDYAECLAVLEERPPGELSPHVYLLCERCAERLRPPVGWTLLDRRETHPVVEIPLVQGIREGDEHRTRSVVIGESA